MDYRIKDILKARGIKVEEFAKEIGIQRETLSRIINGAHTSTDTLGRIAKALSLHVAELYEPCGDGAITCPHCGGKIKIEKG